MKNRFSTAISKAVLTMTLVSIIASMFSFLPGGISFAQDEQNPQSYSGPFVKGRVLVRFRSDAAEAETVDALRGAGRVENEMNSAGVFAVEVPEGKDEETFIEELRRQPGVEFAELDAVLPPAEMNPDDPMYGSQWHLPKINSSAAWPMNTGSDGIVIAILDTGVDPLHPDLQSKLIPGWNFFDNNDNTSDVYGHGTSVAGSAAAAANNTVGVASVAWGCRIMPLRVSDASGYASIYMISTALTWAADHGARVANISYAASNYASIATAAQYFQSKGGVVTISAGNTGTVDTAPDNPYALTVSATSSADTLASWSTRGSNLDVASPGVGVYTTTKGGGYGSKSGTSFSAPIVAGVAALVLSENPALDGAQAQDIIKQSAFDLGTPGWDGEYGWGRVDVGRAVEMAAGTSGTRDTEAPHVSLLSPSTGATVRGTVTLQASATDNTAVASVTFSLDGALLGGVSQSPYQLSWDSTKAVNGVHVLKATATDAAGNSSSVEINVNVLNPLDTPTVTIISPANGSSVSKTVAVTVNATDNVAVTRVELYVDNRLIDTSRRAPFATRWNTKAYANGQHQLVCKAYDAAGNVGTSPVVYVYKGMSTGE
jgi:subtilisin family serine protease